MPLADLEPVPLAIPADEIEAQLARMLDSQHFRHSLRYPALLKYLVEQTQQGKGSLLKERLLGIEVFHRAPDYDTNTDPVVRVTAAEVRKRIAQYYLEPEHSSEIRIDLPTGSYVPRFSRSTVMQIKPGMEPAAEASGPASVPETAASDMAVVEPAAPEIAVPMLRQSTTTFRRTGWVAAAALCLGVLIGVAALRLPVLIAAWQEHAVTAFWGPFIAGGESQVEVVIGDHRVGFTGNALRAEQGMALNPTDDVLKLMNDYEQITLSDVTSLFRLTNYMVRHNQNFQISGAGAADIADLRNGPVMLFAGLDNRWTMRLTSKLRFHFVDSSDDKVGIIGDAQTGHEWRVDFTVPYNQQPMDYAIVARYFDPLLEQPVMIAAGIGATGTVAASEFVTSEHCIDELKALAPKEWHNGNVELVLALPVIDGHAGPPHILAAQFW